MKIHHIASMLVLLLTSCSQKQQKKTIYIQPFLDIPLEKAEAVYFRLKKIYSNTKLLTAIPLPKSSYYTPRNRYRADSIIHWLRDRAQPNEIIIGLTTKDISTTKNKIEDYGVIGLGFTPGRACVVSTFRLSKHNLDEQFFKVSVHELGHTQGLPHCADKTCLMRDANGQNPTNEEKEFCNNCKRVLQSNGWKM